MNQLEMNILRRKLDDKKKELEAALKEIKSLKEENELLSEHCSKLEVPIIDKVTQKQNKDKQIDELISISLWSIRRLPTNSLKHYALCDLKKVVGDSHKHSEFINKCIGDIPIES